MENDKAGGFVSKLIFNNNECVEIQQNDIVVFVGPNNAGKSQSLKDIYSLCKGKVHNTVVVSDIEVKKSKISLEDALSYIASYEEDGNSKKYNVLGKTFYYSQYSNEQFTESYSFDSFRDLFIANLDTSARLTICNAPRSIARDDAKSHPIHYAAFDKKYRKWLSDNFKKAFGVDVTPNTQYGAKIPLCIGLPVKLDGEYEDEQSRQEAYAEILSTYKQVQDQGDGIKSFTGILLYLMLDCYCTYLIDEPESFLHPPQACIMGQIIGKTLSEQQQAFISTHSEEIIKGLLEACPERIKIIRITRKEDKNFFSILNNDKFNEIWADPLLKYSNIMSSLFHKSVVLCESDSDCKMYSIIESHIKQTQQKYSETLFIHCGGKHRMAKIARALRALNINVRLIPDIDVMNDETIFRGIVESFGIDWETIQSDYKIIVSNLHSVKEKISRNETRNCINQVLESSSNQYLSNLEIKNIRAAITVTSKWEAIKSSGVSAIPSGDATRSFRTIDQLLREHNIFIVPAGELECFIKEVGGHGPEWVNRVLETYPNLDDDVYSQIIAFINSIDL